MANPSSPVKNNAGPLAQIGAWTFSCDPASDRERLTCPAGSFPEKVRIAYRRRFWFKRWNKDCNALNYEGCWGMPWLTTKPSVTSDDRWLNDRWLGVLPG